MMTVEPMAAVVTMLSLSAPPSTVPVFPACRMTVSLPAPPATVTSPEPVRMLSAPSSPTIVPGPTSAD